jgi:flavin-binding protein dodecin
MEDSVYKIVELVGTSPLSWEDAVKNVVQKAKGSLHDLRVAEVSELDVKIEGGEVRLLNEDEVLATVQDPTDILHKY